MAFMPILEKTGLAGLGDKISTPFSFPILPRGTSSPVSSIQPPSPDMQEKWKQFLNQQLLSQIGLNKISSVPQNAENLSPQLETPLMSEQTPQPATPIPGVYDPKFPDTNSLAWNRLGYPENYPNIVYTRNVEAEQAPPPDYPAPPGTEWVYNRIPGESGQGTIGYWYLIGTPQ